MSTFTISKPAHFYVIVSVSSYNNSQADIRVVCNNNTQGYAKTESGTIALLWLR